MSRKSATFGLSNNLPLLLAILAVFFSLPLIVMSAVSNVYFQTQSKAVEEPKLYRAEFGMVEMQTVPVKSFVFKSSLGRSYKLLGTNLNVPSDLTSFSSKNVLLEGYVVGVNFYANTISLANKIQNAFKSEGYVLDTGNKNFSKEGVYYLSPTPNSTLGYFIVSYPDRLSPLVGKKVRVSGTLWTTSVLNRQAVNALDIAPLTK